LRRGYLRYFLRTWDTEGKQNKYDARYWMGRYYAACAKEEGPKSKATARYYRAAKRYLELALELGTEIDTNMQCDWRQETCRKQLALLEETLTE
jgi:hypothetical protein